MGDHFCFYMCYILLTVQPVGIPLAPVGQPVMLEAFLKLPDEETPDTQLSKQPEAEISVARQVMLLRLLQYLNKYL